MTSLPRKIWRSIRWIAATAKGPAILRPERIDGLPGLSALHHSAHLSAWPEKDDSTCRLSLGRQVYVGKDVEIAAVGPGSVSIGDFTTFQDRCQIYGDLHIGAHCIFARNVLVISTEHQIRQKPNWLISDQDQFYAQTANSAGRKIRIEDDCWLGWNCTVMPGVYIGRGAVIGANCVVTRDVAPYEVHGGVPNKRIAQRLEFSPPAAISALDDEHLPYFYRGFYLRQADLSVSRSRGGISAGANTMLVLSGTSNSGVTISGSSHGPMTIHCFINGTDCGTHSIGNGEFTLNFSSSDEDTKTFLPTPLQNFTVIEMQAEYSTVSGRLFEISSARLVAA